MDSSFVCFRFLHMPKVSLLFDENQLMRVNSQILHDQGVSTILHIKKKSLYLISVI